MQIQHYFEYKKELDLTVANIGVSKWNWVSVTEETSESDARRIKEENNFDVLPIKDELGNYTHYWGNSELGDYSQVEKRKIGDAYKIYYRTSFKDALNKFISDNVPYYFLSNHYETVGLISWLNFNCLYVYNYLYNQIADLEMHLSEFISKVVSEEEVLDILKGFNICSRM